MTLFYALVVCLGLSFLIIAHELGHFLAARYFNVLVEEFGFGIPPRIFGKKIGETIVSLNWLPIGAFVRVAGLEGAPKDQSKVSVPSNRDFNHQALWKRFLIIGAGVLMNFIVGWLLISSVFVIGIPSALVVAEVKIGSVAAQAGIQEGDQFLDFPNRDILTGFLESHKGELVSVRIRRGSKEIEIPVMPRVHVPPGEGNLGVFLVEAGTPQLSWWASLTRGFVVSLHIMQAIFLGLIDLFIGLFTDINILDKFVGPVGIVGMAIQQTRLGVPYFLQLLAMISLNLAVFNVIPIPALDGGRLLFLIIEKIKGSRISEKTERIVNSVGFAVLVTLILAITVKDVAVLFH